MRQGQRERSAPQVFGGEIPNDSPVAQSAEQRTVNPRVGGSSPPGGASTKIPENPAPFGADFPGIFAFVVSLDSVRLAPMLPPALPPIEFPMRFPEVLCRCSSPPGGALEILGITEGTI